MARKNLRSTAAAAATATAAATIPTADELLSAAPSQFATKSGKSALKTLISSIPNSSPLVSTLPKSLHLSVSKSLISFKESFKPPPLSPSHSPPSKRSRLSPQTQSQTLETLTSYSFVIHLMLSHPKKPFLASDIFPSIQLLHDSLVLYEEDPALILSVASLCEEWWKERLEGRENLISQTIPFFLSKSLSNGKKIDVRRVYALKEALELFDYGDESIEDVRLLLVRCVIAPVYLKSDEGRKFLGFILGLNDRLAKEVLEMVKSQIPFGRKSVLEAYAEIVFRAWKAGERWLKEEIEDGFVQGLIDAAIHAGSKGLAASVRRVLGGFIEQRVTEGVEKLLFRLSEPVLFRSLQVANSNVRQNALHLFLDLFPLEDPHVTKDVKDALLNKQFFLLEKLLLDECPDVRAVAVEGSCRVLNLFWEVIPPAVITKTLTKVIDCMSSDMCSDVRLSTVNGIIYLLENPQSHEIMKVLLPRLGFLFSDPTLSVRVAVTDLLLSVRDIRTFQFNKVVSLDDLLMSLANDHQHVAQKVTRLLLPSYFPSKVTSKEACTRCIALIKRSPTAGARFCEFALSEGSSSKSLMELLKISVSLALASKGFNSDQIDGLFVASANICRSLTSEISNNSALNELFSSAKLKCLFAAAPSTRAQTAVLTIASTVSPDDYGIRDLCIDSISNFTTLANDVEKQALVRAAHKLMVSSGWFNELSGALTSNLQSFACGFLVEFHLEPPEELVQSLTKNKVKGPMKTPVRSNKLKGKETPNYGMSKIEKDLSLAAATAWQMKDLLGNVEERNAFLKSPNLEIAFCALRIISQVTVEECLYWEDLDVSAVMAYTAIAMHVSLQNAESSCSKDKNASVPQMSTISDTALTFLLNSAEKLFALPVCGKPTKTPSRSKHGKGTASRRKTKNKNGLSSASVPIKDGDRKTDLPEEQILQNIVKILTPILKYISDAATIGLLSHYHTRCLRFASNYARHLISWIEGHQHKRPPFKEEDTKNAFIYLKSSYSYTLKLLHLVLTSSSESSSPPTEAFLLANNLLDLIVSFESYFGSKYASHIVSVAKPWLPVLILGLGSNHLIKETQQEGTCSSRDFTTVLPLWLTFLGKLELYEFRKLENEQADQIPELDAPVFEQLIRMVLDLLKKGNLKVLDAVGVVLLTATEFGLERGEFGLVSGLLHFISAKLLGKENTSWNELVLMPSFIQEIYLRIKREVEETTLDEDGRQILQGAGELLRSFCAESE